MTLLPALYTEPLPRYRLEARGQYWAVVDHAPTCYRYPAMVQTFTIEACAVACVDALNLTRAK